MLGSACSRGNLTLVALTCAARASQRKLQLRHIKSRRVSQICCGAVSPQSQPNATTQARKAHTFGAVRPVPIRIVTVSKGNSKGEQLMAGEWAEKIRRYTPLDEVRIKPNPKNASSTSAAVLAEGEKVLKSISSQEQVILLDERGKDISSEDMATLIAQAGNTSTGLAFCIGGPFGHSEAVKQRADRSIKLSSMVLNHQVAHVVLLEQIYRGWTMIRGEPYHH